MQATLCVSQRDKACGTSISAVSFVYCAVFLIHLARCVCVMCGHFAIASIQFKAVVIHECTSRFARSLFKYHLGSKYTVHTFNPPAVL